MPQAMILAPVAAAAAPTSAPAMAAGSGSAAGKPPGFAGLLQQLGRTGPVAAADSGGKPPSPQTDAPIGLAQLLRWPQLATATGDAAAADLVDPGPVAPPANQAADAGQVDLAPGQAGMAPGNAPAAPAAATDAPAAMASAGGQAAALALLADADGAIPTGTPALTAGSPATPTTPAGRATPHRHTGVCMGAVAADALTAPPAGTGPADAAVAATAAPAATLPTAADLIGPGQPGGADRRREALRALGTPPNAALSNGAAPGQTSLSATPDADATHGLADAPAPAAPSSKPPTPPIGAPTLPPSLAAIQPNPVAVPASPGDPASAAAATPANAAAPTASHQVSAALVSLGQGADGTQRMTLRLQPTDLGQVQISIERPQDAPARVDITVERPETLTLLLRDQPQLQRALDQAGVPADGRSLTLHVAPPDIVAPSAGAHGGNATGAGLGQSTGNGSGGGTRSWGHTGGGDAAEITPDDAALPLALWLRAGLDITA